MSKGPTVWDWCDFLRARTTEERHATEGAALTSNGIHAPRWELAEPGADCLGVRAGDALTTGARSVTRPRHQPLPGTRSTTAATRSIMRDGETLDASRKPWTVFHLSGTGTIDKITPVIQQGRYVPVGHLRKAVTSGSLVVPTLDEAFPARK
ncbi:hypothetical protein ACFU99_14445 [Streptomyces sp. NPDC057654]|uniref:hypothetical protein n=1 Tax=Streptomyces sp. NPDC057654 TaxID=3346196 RepID=UPI00368264BF